MGQKVDNGQNEDKTWMTYIGMQHPYLDNGANIAKAPQVY